MPRSHSRRFKYYPGHRFIPPPDFANEPTPTELAEWKKWKGIS